MIAATSDEFYAAIGPHDITVEALTAIARHIDWHDDVLNVPLN